MKTMYLIKWRSAWLISFMLVMFNTYAYSNLNHTVLFGISYMIAPCILLVCSYKIIKAL